MLNDFSILLFRVQSVPSDVQKEGLGQTVLRSVFATTTENVTLKLDSVSVLKVSLVTGKQVIVDLWTACGCFRLFLLFLCRCLSSMLTGATSNVWISHRQRKVVFSTLQLKPLTGESTLNCFDTVIHFFCLQIKRQPGYDFL